MSTIQDPLLGMVNSLAATHEEAGSMEEEGNWWFGAPLGEVVPLVGEISEYQEVEVTDSGA